MSYPWRTRASRDSKGHIATKSKYQKVPLAVKWRDFAPSNFGVFLTVLTRVLTVTENIFSAILKGKLHPTRGYEGPQARIETCFYSFFNLSARWARVVNTTTKALYSRERNPVTIVQKAG
jgi:hypothetical protein